MPRQYARKTPITKKAKAGRKVADVAQVIESVKAKSEESASAEENAASCGTSEAFVTTRELAAQMVAEGRFDYKEVADKVGINRETLSRWRKQPEFADRVTTITREMSAEIMKRGLCRKEYRLSTLASLQSKLLTVFEERGADPDMQNISGGKTGLIVKTYKIGKDICMPEYAVDAGAIRTLQAIQEQAAKELGQLVEKRETTLNLKEMTDEQIAATIADLAADSSADAGIGSASGVGQA